MKLLIPLTLIFAIAAFVPQQPAPATSQPADPAQQEQKATNPPATGTKATLYVYRLRDMGGMFNRPSVYIDEREIARIANGRFFIVNLDPGRHVVRSDDKTSAVTLEMKPGQVYYIRVAFEPTRYTVRAETTLVPPEQGWSEIGHTESSNPKDIKDHELAVVGVMPSKPTSVPAPAEDLSVPGGSAPGTCRSIAVTRSLFPSPGYKVLDVVNYPDAYVGKWYEMNDLPVVQKRDGVFILVLTKGYTPQDVASAHSYCQSRTTAAEPKEMVEGTLADALLQADIAKMIRVMETADHPNCEFQIVKQLHSAGKPGVERWEVKSCDATSSYDVSIVHSPKGGADFRVGKSVLEQQKKADTAAQPPVSSQAGTADALPEGFVVYEGQKSQFTIALPKGWVAYDQSQMLPGKGNSQFNLIFFYLPPNPTSRDSMSVELITKIDTGEIPAFFVQKLPAKNGMSCGGFPEKAEKEVFKLVTGDPMFGKGAAILEAPRSEPISVAGCKGIRIRGTGKPARENTPQTSDVYAVSDGKTLYLFTLRGTADNYKKNTEVFQKAVATARLTAAK